MTEGTRPQQSSFGFSTVVCAVAGCPRPVKARGYCKVHHKHLLRHGLIEKLPAGSPFCSVPGCGKPHVARGYCNMHRCRLQAGRPLGGPALTTEDRFWSKVGPRDDPDACHLWQGWVDRDGYGRFTRVHGKHLGAHRFAFILAEGPLADDTLVCHTCDVRYLPGDRTYRRCVNRFHLFAGTEADNSADMVAKGRQARGEHNPNAVLSAPQVQEIRARYADGGTRQEDLAREHRVGQGTISSVVRRETWQHVP